MSNLEIQNKTHWKAEDIRYLIKRTYYAVFQGRVYHLPAAVRVRYPAAGDDYKVTRRKETPRIIMPRRPRETMLMILPRDQVDPVALVATLARDISTDLGEDVRSDMKMLRSLTWASEIRFRKKRAGRDFKFTE